MSECSPTHQNKLNKGYKMKNDRLQVLQLKMQGLAPEQIAHKLDMRLAEVFKHDMAIKAQMAKEQKTDLSHIAPDALNDVMEAMGNLLPYMEVGARKMLKQSQGLKQLHNDMVENYELTTVLLQKAITAELSKDEPDLNSIQKITAIQNDMYAAIYNKNGVQVINLINADVDGEAQQKADDLKKLRMDIGVTDAEIVTEDGKDA